MSLAQKLVSDFEKENTRTKHVLEAVPEDKLDFKPHEKSMSLGELAGHLAETPMWGGSMMEDVMDFAEMPDYKPYVVTNKAEMMGTLDKNASAFLEMMKDRDDAFMEATWTMKMGDKVLMSDPRHEAMRDILVHHSVHHRGQLTVYLRLLGVPVPATYGGTADHPML